MINHKLMTASEGVKFVFQALQHLFCTKTPTFSFSPSLTVSSETTHYVWQCYMLSILALIKYFVMIKIITFCRLYKVIVLKPVQTRK